MVFDNGKGSGGRDYGSLKCYGIMLDTLNCGRNGQFDIQTNPNLNLESEEGIKV